MSLRHLKTFTNKLYQKSYKLVKSKFIKIFKILMFIAVLLLCWVLYVQWCNNSKVDDLKKSISNNEDRVNDLEKENLELTIQYDKINNNDFSLISSKLNDLEREYELQSEFHFLRTEEEKELTLSRIRNNITQAKTEFEEVYERMTTIQKEQENNIEEIETLKKQTEEYRDKIYDLRH